jgi:hypothetical protein
MLVAACGGNSCRLGVLPALFVVRSVQTHVFDAQHCQLAALGVRWVVAGSCTSCRAWQASERDLWTGKDRDHCVTHVVVLLLMVLGFRATSG